MLVKGVICYACLTLTVGHFSPKKEVDSFSFCSPLYLLCSLLNSPLLYMHYPCAYLYVIPGPLQSPCDAALELESNYGLGKYQLQG